MLSGQIDERVIVIYEADERRRFHKTLEAIQAEVPIIFTSGKAEQQECCLTFEDKEISQIEEALRNSRRVDIIYSPDCDSQVRDVVQGSDIYHHPAGQTT